jgi:hypothetical protein
MGSVAMIYILSSIKIASGIQKLIRGTHRHTDGVVASYAPFYFFQYRESRLII